LATADSIKTAAVSRVAAALVAIFTLNKLELAEGFHLCDLDEDGVLSIDDLDKVSSILKLDLIPSDCAHFLAHISAVGGGPGQAQQIAGFTLALFGVDGDELLTSRGVDAALLKSKGRGVGSGGYGAATAEPPPQQPQSSASGEVLTESNSEAHGSKPQGEEGSDHGARDASPKPPDALKPFACTHACLIAAARSTTPAKRGEARAGAGRERAGTDVAAPDACSIAAALAAAAEREVDPLGEENVGRQIMVKMGWKPGVDLSWRGGRVKEWRLFRVFKRGRGRGLVSCRVRIVGGRVCKICRLCRGAGLVWCHRGRYVGITHPKLLLAVQIRTRMPIP
jgi:hypothetical protein